MSSSHSNEKGVFHAGSWHKSYGQFSTANLSTEDGVQGDYMTEGLS